MVIEVPAPVRRVIDAINAADTEAFVAAFTADGAIDDWGRVLSGPDGVRSWAATDAIGARAVLTLVGATVEGDTTEIVFDWRSTVFNGRSRAFVTVRDGLVAEFRIPAE